MLLIILATFLYAVLVTVSSMFLNSLSVPMFLTLLYIVPVCINLVLIKLQKSEKYKRIYSLLLPTLAMGAYVLFAYLTSNSGVWGEFVQLNTLANDDISVDIAEDLLSTTQILFAALVYYASSITLHLLSKSNKKAKKGVTYA